MAMDVMDTNTVMMIVVMAMATINSIRVNPFLDEKFRGFFMIGSKRES